VTQNELNEFGGYQRHVASQEQNGFRASFFECCINSTQRAAFRNAIAANDADRETSGAGDSSNMAENGCAPETQAGFITSHSFAVTTSEDANFERRRAKLFNHRTAEPSLRFRVEGPMTLSLSALLVGV
jgi:hypothetical protein